MKKHLNNPIKNKKIQILIIISAVSFLSVLSETFPDVFFFAPSFKTPSVIISFYLFVGLISLIIAIRICLNEMLEGVENEKEEMVN